MGSPGLNVDLAASPPLCGRRSPRLALELPGPLPLDHSAAVMAAVVRCSHHREAGNGSRMALGGLSLALALAIGGRAGPTQGERGDSGSHSL
jgi:hypothetical protein